MKINIEYHQDTNYSYTQSSYCQDETESNSNNNFNAKVSFNHDYCILGIYYNR